MDKKIARLKRARRTRAKIRNLHVNKLCIHRTPRHIYVQLIAPNGNILTSASTLDKSVRGEISNGGNIHAAKFVGELIAKRCLDIGVKEAAFDRSGFKYHGRIKALADAAREHGLEI